MRNFFRKKRKTLADENKTMKYARYAIGEILLVVIGILIALSINTWNEKRKATKIEYEYYCRIIEDLEIDLEKIDNQYQKAEEQIEICRSLIIDLFSMTKDKNYLMNTYLKALRSDTFFPSKAAFQDIKSSGNLNLITNIKIKNNLIRYYSELENLTKQLNQNTDEIVRRAFDYKYVNEVGYQEFDYLKKALGPEILALLPKVDWHLNKESNYFKQFESNLVLMIALKERKKQHFDRIKNEMQPLYDSLKNLCNN